VNRWLLLAVAASVGLAACSKEEEAAAPPAAEPPQSAAPAPQAAGKPAATPNSGKVVQLEQGGGYTYAEVETADGRKVWIAGGQIDIKPGDTVQWGDYAVMKNFNAKSLNRTFDQILFVNTWGPAGAATTGVAPHGVQPGQQPVPQAAAPANPADASAPAANVGRVKSAESAGGYTYLEVEQNGSTLWIAAPETQVKAGDKVSWDSGMVMRNFKSSSLNRTFDEIVFAGAVRVTP